LEYLTGISFVPPLIVQGTNLFKEATAFAKATLFLSLFLG